MDVFHVALPKAEPGSRTGLSGFEEGLARSFEVFGSIRGFRVGSLRRFRRFQKFRVEGLWGKVGGSPV